MVTLYTMELGNGYELWIRIDMNRSGSRLCRSTAALFTWPDWGKPRTTGFSVSRRTLKPPTLLDTRIDCCLLQPSAVLCRGYFVAVTVVCKRTVYLKGSIEARRPDRLSSRNTTLHSVCIVELHVTVKYIQILTVAQQCFCGKCMWPATIKGTYVFV